MAKHKIILFGTGKYGREAYDYFGSENIICFVDNNSDIAGKNVLNKNVVYANLNLGHMAH